MVAHLTIQTDDCFHSLVMSLEIDKSVASFSIHLDFQDNAVDLEQLSQFLISCIGSQVADIYCSNKAL